jgi:hypothetical protein
VHSDREIPYDWRQCTERAVRNARPRTAGKHPRWTAIMDAFGCGSTVAWNLCLAFGLDPDEEIKR